jgi:predicted GIY-YIG superfamily endonuclease
LTRIRAALAPGDRRRDANDLATRIASHRAGLGSEFVWKDRLFRLVCIQCFASVLDAIAQEKRPEEMAAALENSADRKGQSRMRDLFDELLS